MGEQPKTQDSATWLRRNLIGAALALLAGMLIISLQPEYESPADPENPSQVARGQVIYAQHCAACHGVRLEGQPNWRERLPGGRMPAPPHDASGHTWHHSDEALFGMTKHGLVPGRYAPPGHESDMPAFTGILSDDDIWDVLAYIKSYWPEEIRAAQRKLTTQRRSRGQQETR
jgi:S-disulfanyl-L-cysteine oxidoreductase SoxD